MNTGEEAKVLQRAAGVRSYRQLVDKARQVSVGEKGGVFELVSTYRGDDFDGWAFDPPDQGVRLASPSDAELGSGVRKAMTQSR